MMCETWEAMNNALRLQPDLPEVHLTYAYHLYDAYRDYKRARVQLAIALRGLPNNSDAMSLEATSLHLTVGIHQVTWASILLAALQRAIKEDPLLRESLPAGFASDARLQHESEARLQAHLQSVVGKIASGALIDTGLIVAGPQ